MEEGKDTKNIQRRYPEIRRAYEMYLESRQRSLLSTTVQSGKDQKRLIVPYTTGYGPLPEQGGLMDQPYRLMEFWSSFIQGDRIATLKSLS